VPPTSHHCTTQLEERPSNTLVAGGELAELIQNLEREST